MNVKYEYKSAMIFIGFSTSISPKEGYIKCPEFWDKEYSQKYARLWQTMKPETQDEKDLEARVREALKSVHLDNFEKRYPHQLSGGQQQRVAFARAIAVRPKCILFDEPLSALDALLRVEMRRELAEFTSYLGITSVFVTHDQIEAMSMSDKIAVLNGGFVEQYDSPEAVYHNPQTECK